MCGLRSPKTVAFVEPKFNDLFLQHEHYEDEKTLQAAEKVEQRLPNCRRPQKLHIPQDPADSKKKYQLCDNERKVIL